MAVLKYGVNDTVVIRASLTIGRLAQAARVNVETIRFYQRKRLIPEPDRPFGGIRCYGPLDVERVRFIKSAQRLGFSLEEVGQPLRLDAGMQCSPAAQLASRHLTQVRARLKDLRRIEAALTKLLGQCAHHRGEVACPLIAALHTAPRTGELARCRRLAKTMVITRRHQTVRPPLQSFRYSRISSRPR